MPLDRREGISLWRKKLSSCRKRSVAIGEKSFDDTACRLARSLLISGSTSPICKGDRPMMDILFLIVVIAFFAGAIAYVEGCERL